MQNIQALKQADLLAIISSDANLLRVASSGGGEWAGPCPFCGGSDRFRVQPHHPAGARWFCRGCGDGKWHDVIDYIMRRDGLTFQQAIDGLSPMNTTKEKTKESTIDREKWKERAAIFIAECESLLWKDEGNHARQWLYNRGLKPCILKEWGIGFNPIDRKEQPESWGLDDKPVWIPKGIVIPCRDALGLHYVKIRQSKREPKYFILRGGKMMLYGADTLKDFWAAFLFESELDVLLAIQTEYKVGYISIPAGQDIKQFGNLFGNITDLIVAFDNDNEGQKGADKICSLSKNIRKAQPFPAGKDLTEYHQGGGDVLDYLWDELGRLGDGGL